MSDAGAYGIEVTILEATPNADQLVCKSARNDYLPTDEWVGSNGYDRIMGSATTEGLIRKLLKPPGHFGPFEHPQVTFAIRGISRVTMAQLTRHRLASFDVQSSRYTMPDIDLIREIRDGDAPLDELRRYVVVPKIAVETSAEYPFLHNVLDAFESYAWLYDHAVEQGHPERRAKEDARYLLPKALRVNVVMSCNLRMLMHVADMRAAGDAQWEIQAVTDELLDVASTVAPVTMGVYEDELHGRKHRLAP